MLVVAFNISIIFNELICLYQLLYKSQKLFKMLFCS